MWCFFFSDSSEAGVSADEADVPTSAFDALKGSITKALDEASILF